MATQKAPFWRNDPDRIETRLFSHQIRQSLTQRLRSWSLQSVLEKGCNRLACRHLKLRWRAWKLLACIFGLFFFFSWANNTHQPTFIFCIFFFLEDCLVPPFAAPIGALGFQIGNAASFTRPEKPGERSTLQRRRRSSPTSRVFMFDVAILTDCCNVHFTGM